MTTSALRTLELVKQSWAFLTCAEAALGKHFTDQRVHRPAGFEPAERASTEPPE
ncbi:MAG: hypothetical protein WKF73_01970 [Nocardioidaceae bacterium]